MSYLDATSKSAFPTYFAVPVICGALIELLAQFERDLGVFEGALGLDDNLITLLGDDDRWLGNVANLPCRKTNTCQSKVKSSII